MRAAEPGQVPKRTGRDAFGLHETSVTDTPRYRVMWAASRLLVRALFRVRVDGLHNWPEAPFCIVLNHHNAWDPMIVIAGVPPAPRITWFGPRVRTDEFATTFQYQLMAYFGGVIPIDPEKSTLTSAVRAVRAVFAAGGVLGIFAEGSGHFQESRIAPFEDGAVTFATAAGVPIVPAVVVGTTYLWWGKRLRVSFGAPIATAGVRGASARAELTEHVRSAMTEMLPNREPGGPEGRPLWRFLTDLFHDEDVTSAREAELGR